MKKKILMLLLCVMLICVSLFIGERTLAATNVPMIETEESTTDPSSGDIHEHTYNPAGKIEPTCTEDGKEVFTCGCGESYFNTIKKLGHDYAKVKTVAPRVSAKGYSIYKCKRCGDEVKKDFVPALKNIKVASVENVKSEYIFTGKQIKPKPVVKDGTAKLRKGRDYTVYYSKNIKKGTAKLIITGKGKYGGKKTFSFKIKAADISKVSISGFNAYKKFTGVERKQGVTLKYKGKKLKNDVDFTKNYKNNVNLGTAELIIKGKGNFTGKLVKKYWIVRKGWFKEDGNCYYYSDKGKKYTGGQYQIGENYYFFNGSGVRQTGWQIVESCYCLFDRSSTKKVFGKTVDGISIDKNGNAVLTSWSSSKISVMMKAHKVMLNVTNPTDTMEEKRLKCFNWILSLPYRQYRKLNSMYKTAGWEMTFANDIFDRGQGCCVSQSAAAAFLFREIGYTDVYVCHDTGHAWLMIGDRLYDPVFAEAKSFSRNYNVIPYDYRKNPVGKRYIG